MEILSDQCILGRSLKGHVTDITCVCGEFWIECGSMWVQNSVQQKQFIGKDLSLEKYVKIWRIKRIFDSI